MLGSDKMVSLGKLLGDKRLTAGVTYGRYGPLLNPIVDRHKGESNIDYVTKYNNIIRMLFENRFDYIIEYPPVINYYEKLENKEGVVIKVPIKEVVELKPYFTAYVVCPKNEWGNRVIEKINKILLEERNTQRYREILLRWYNEEIRQQVGKYLESEFSAKRPESVE